MKSRSVPVLLLGLTWAAWAQQSSDQNPPPAPAQPAATEPYKSPGAAKDIGTGAGDIGVGAAKGTGEAAKGVGKGAVDLVTLHPLNAAGAVGKGAAVGGKDVAVGTAKGAGKITRGIGKAFKKLF